MIHLCYSECNPCGRSPRGSILCFCIQGDAFTLLLRAITGLGAAQSVASQLLAMNISRETPQESTSEPNGSTSSKFAEFKQPFLHEVKLLEVSSRTHLPNYERLNISRKTNSDLVETMEERSGQVLSQRSSLLLHESTSPLSFNF